MNSPTAKNAQTFGDWAYVAIAKHYRKMGKHEAEVLKDKDPEELHQMRVGMRRLRSTISGFSPAIYLPSAAREKKVGKFARILGELRDLDVLKEALENQYKPALPKEEKKQLNQALKVLKERRKDAFERVKLNLSKESYQHLKQDFESWLKKPQYQAIASVSIEVVLPDLLLPQACKLLLHPGWWVGVKIGEREIKISEKLDTQNIEEILNVNAKIIHDLRKEAKRSRYQMELFTKFYDEQYAECVKKIKEIQTILGDIQDSFVLAEFLAEVLHENLQKKMPVLMKLLKEKREQKWQLWQVLQNYFLNLETRNDLRLTVQNPNPNGDLGEGEEGTEE